MAAMHSTRINLIRVCDVFGGFSHKAGEPTLPAIVAESSQSPLKWRWKPSGRFKVGSKRAKCLS